MKIKSIFRSKDTRVTEVIKFLIVGLLSTGVLYGIYNLTVFFVNPTIAYTIGYIISLAVNFYLTARYTFRVTPTVKKGMGFIVSHAVNYMLQIVLLNVFLGIGLEKALAPLLVFPICIPVNFLLVRFFVKR